MLICFNANVRLHADSKMLMKNKRAIILTIARREKILPTKNQEIRYAIFPNTPANS